MGHGIIRIQFSSMAPLKASGVLAKFIGRRNLEGKEIFGTVRNVLVKDRKALEDQSSWPWSS
jgi:hypothetical protein